LLSLATTVLSVWLSCCSLLLFVYIRRVYCCVLLPAQLSTDRLLSLANAGCPLRLAVLLLAAVAWSFTSVVSVDSFARPALY
jgi:hypothetical protein